MKENPKKSLLKKAIDRIELKLAIKTALSAGLGWFAGLHFSHLLAHPDSLISGAWCAIASIIVIQTHLGGTYKAALNLFVGIFIGSALGGMFTYYLGATPTSLGISVFFTLIACSLLNIKESIRMACVSTAIVMIFWGLRPNVSPWTFAFFRIVDSTLGIIIAVIIAHALWPYQARTHLRNNMGKILSYLNELFLTVTKEEGKETEEIYSRIKEKLNQLFKDNLDYIKESRLELMTQTEELRDWTLLHTLLENLYVQINTLARGFPYSKKIFDATLDEHIKILLSQIDHSLHHSALVLSVEKPMEEKKELQIAFENLQMDRARFRNTHLTRNYDLKDVENFYLFFSSLETIVDSIQKIDNVLAELITIETNE